MTCTPVLLHDTAEPGVGEQVGASPGEHAQLEQRAVPAGPVHALPVGQATVVSLRPSAQIRTAVVDPQVAPSVQTAARHPPSAHTCELPQVEGVQVTPSAAQVSTDRVEVQRVAPAVHEATQLPPTHVVPVPQGAASHTSPSVAQRSRRVAPQRVAPGVQIGAHTPAAQRSPDAQSVAV